jgi:hypothetical protein
MKFIYLGIIVIVCGVIIIVFSNKNTEKSVNCDLVTKILENNKKADIAIMKDGDENLILLSACGSYSTGSQHSSFNPITRH